jgi:PAS domain S-box-containing protein
MNAEFGRILGRTNRELNKLRWSDITHPDDLDTELSLYEKMRRGAINGYSLEKRFIKPDGSFIWVNVVNAAMQTDAEEGSRYIVILQDINEQKLMQDALRESERSKTVFLSNLPGMAYRCAFDKDWTMEFVSDGCQTLTGYSPQSLVRNKELSFNDLIAPEYRDVLWLEWERVLSLRMPFQYEYEIVCADGRHKWVLEMGQGVFNDGEEPEALEGIILDITEQKEKEKLIGFMSRHDTLTGLYNRKHYEDMIETLDAENKVPLSIIVADINGVRLVNNALAIPRETASFGGRQHIVCVLP